MPNDHDARRLYTTILLTRYKASCNSVLPATSKKVRLYTYSIQTGCFLPVHGKDSSILGRQDKTRDRIQPANAVKETEAKCN